MDYTLCGTSAMILANVLLATCGDIAPQARLTTFSQTFRAAAAVLLSGNIFSQIDNFAEFMGLSFISPSTFFRVQKLYCIPAIEEWWQWMRGELVVEFKNEELVVSGDGQCD